MAFGLTLGCRFSSSAVTPRRCDRVGPGGLGQPVHGRFRDGRPVGAATAAAPAAAAATAANVNCTIIVPADPLSARAWRRRLAHRPGERDAAASGSTMTNAVNLGGVRPGHHPRTAHGRLSVPDPLVITAGTTPAVTPVVPKLPRARDRHHRLRVQRHGPFPAGCDANALAQGNCVERPADRSSAGVILQRHRLLRRGLRPDARGDSCSFRQQEVGEDGANGQRDRNQQRLPDRP